MLFDKNKLLSFSERILNYLLLWCVLIWSSCGNSTNTTQQNEGVKIIGNTTNLTMGFVYIEQITPKNERKVLDSVEVENNGNFSLYVPVKDPSIYILNFNHKQQATLLLTGKEQEVKIKAHGNDPNGFFSASGSIDTDYKLRMDKIMMDYQKNFVSLQQQQQVAQINKDINTFQNVSLQMQQSAVYAENQIKKVIKESVPSLAAAYGARMIRMEENVIFIDSILNQLVPVFPNHPMVNDLKNEIIIRKKLALGMEAPEIILPDKNGKMVKLSNFRGKYVFIDFWAAWCRPCRIENPNIVKVYNNYSNKQFEIIGVSLDKSRDAWIKAIEDDKLPWVHVSDLKFWESPIARTYQINAIPASFLIDPGGKIIAKNLRGKALDAKLKEIFG